MLWKNKKEKQIEPPLNLIETDERLPRASEFLLWASQTLPIPVTRTLLYHEFNNRYKRNDKKKRSMKIRAPGQRVTRWVQCSRDLTKTEAATFIVAISTSLFLSLTSFSLSFSLSLYKSVAPHRREISLGERAGWTWRTCTVSCSSGPT